MGLVVLLAAAVGGCGDGSDPELDDAIEDVTITPEISPVVTTGVVFEEMLEPISTFMRDSSPTGEIYDFVAERCETLEPAEQGEAEGDFEGGVACLGPGEPVIGEELATVPVTALEEGTTWTLTLLFEEDEWNVIDAAPEEPRDLGDDDS